MKTRSQKINCADVALKVNPTPTGTFGFGSLHTSIIDSPQLLRHSSPEFPRSPAPSATGRSKIYEVNIDFDDASAAWRMNKKSTGGGCYKYICEAKTQLGNNCLREPMLGCAYCKTHNKSNTPTSDY